MPFPIENRAALAPHVEIRTGERKIRPYSITRPETTHGAHHENGHAWTMINNYLGERPSYAQESTLTQYVQGRLNVLTDNAVNTPQVVVVHDEIPNAFAIPGFVVIHDGLLKRLEFQEEVDALLAHEGTHISHEHVHTAPNSNFVRNIGSRRGHEAEADIVGAMEVMDTHGVNPLGQISLLQKLYEYQTEQEAQSGKKKGFKAGDVEHGSLTDRILNLDEAFWLMDVRNLSNNPLTPLAVAPDVFEEYMRDEDLLQAYDTLDPLTKRHFIQRQLKKIGSDQEGIVELADLHRIQRDIFLTVYPDMTEAAADDLTEYTFMSMTFKEYEKPEHRTTFQARFRFLSNPERVVQVLNNLDKSKLNELGITTKLHNEITNNIFKEHLRLQSEFDLEMYKNIITSVQETTGVDTSEYAAEALVSYLSGDPEAWQAIDKNAVSNFVANTTLHMDDIDPYFPEGNRKDDENSAFNKSIVLIRKKNAQAIEDPMEYFQYITKYGRDEVTSWYLTLGLERNDQPANYYDMVNAINPVVSGRSESAILQEILESGEENIAQNKKLIRQIYRYFNTNPEGIENVRDHMTLLALQANDTSDLASGVNIFLSTIYSEEEWRNFSIAELQLVMQGIAEGISRAKSAGFAEDIDLSVSDYRKSGAIKNVAVHAYFNEAERIGDNAPLVELLEHYPIDRISRIAYAQDYDEVDALRDQWDSFVQRALASESLMTDNEALLQLVALGLMSDNVHVNLQVPAQAMEQVIKNVSFQEGLEIVFERFNHLPGLVFHQAVEHLIEEKARTPEDFAKLNIYLRDNIKNFLGGDEVIGQLALADGLLIDNYAALESSNRVQGLKSDLIEGLEPARLLNAMLESGDGDQELKEYMFERWWLRYRTNLTAGDVDEVEQVFRIEDFATFYYPHSKENRLRGWIRELPPEGSYVPLADVGDEVYRVSEPMKYYALRKILTGEHGVLGNEQERNALVDGFMETWIDFGEDEQAKQTFTQVITSLFQVADERELYHQVNPFLINLILHPPDEPYSYKDLAYEKAGKVIDEMLGRGKLQRSRLRPKRMGDSKVPDDQDFLAFKIRRLITGGKNVEETSHVENTVDRLLSRFPRTSTDLREDRFSPLDAFFLFGESTGAVGTRMLQQIGMYKPDLAEEDRQRFMDVYDSVKGQSRLQAYRTLTREAESSPQIAELLDRAVEIRPRIGGGSLVTVFEVLLDDGSREAVGVKNPNTEYHVENIINLFDKTLTDVLEKDPNNHDYRLMKAILSDTKDWIMREVTDPRFEEKDAKFRELNDSRYGNFDNANNRYGIYIPEHKPTGTRWVRRDEYVEGKNLTALTITEGHTDIHAGLITQEDFQSATSLIILNSMHQLSTGLVHSDIHPGQFRITTDNSNVAIFDRYNLLELDEAQQRLIGDFMEASVSGSIEPAITKTVDYLFQLDQNSGLADKKQQVVSEVNNALAASNSETSSLDAIISLKQHGVHIPLEITLIAKNLLVMTKMAKDAGFQGITDALFANYQ